MLLCSAVMVGASASSIGCGGNNPPNPPPVDSGGGGTDSGVVASDAGADARTDVPTTVVRLIANPTTVPVTEGATATFTIALSAPAPTALTVNVASNNTAAATVSPATVQFAAGDMAAKTVTVTAPEDTNIASEMVTITAMITGLDPVNVRVDVTDNDMVMVQAPTMATVVEGRTAEVMVRLSAAPTGNVTIAVSSSATSKLTVAPTTLTFTPANFATAQTITLTGVADDDTANDTANLVLAATGAAPATTTIPVSITDDDSQNLAISSGSLRVTEGGAAGTFTVTLTQRPAANLTVTIGTRNMLVATGAPTTLTFTPANFSTAQTVSVTGVQDNDLRNDATDITVDAPGLTQQVVRVDVTDDDVQTIAVLPVGVISINEGSNTTITVRPTFDPGGGTSITASSSATGKLTVSPTSAPFNSTTFTMPASLTLNALEDSDTANDSVTVTLTGAGAVDVTIMVNIVDNDQQGITLSPETAVSLTEGGTTTVTAHLDFAPGATVTLAAMTQNGAVATISPATITFNDGNYLVPQTFTITAPPDANGAADSTTIAFTTGSITENLTVNVNDRDTQGFNAQPSTITIGEGASDSFTVSLNLVPGSPINAVFESNNPKITVSPPSATLSDTTPVTVTVSGAQDADAVDESAIITVRDSATTPAAPSTPVNVRVLDDEMQRIVLTSLTAPAGTSSGNPIAVREGSAPADQFTVALAAAPVGTVTVSLASTNTGSITVSSTTLTFDASNYMTPQSISITAHDDTNLVDEDVEIIATLSGAPNNSIFARNREDDLQAIVINPSGTITVTEDENPATFIEVSLQYQPATTVQISIASNQAYAVVGTGTLLFTTTDYNIPQRVLVTTPSDADQINPGSATITASVTGVPSVTVNVDVLDNDVQSIIFTPQSLTVQEDDPPGPRSQTFEVSLAFVPTSATETVSVTSTDTNKATVSTPSLSFNAGNYSTPQMVTVTSVDDVDVDNEDISVLLDSSLIAGAVNGTISVRVTDNDIINLDNNPVSVTLDEGPGGTTSTVATLRLTRDPSTPLTVALVSSNAANVAVSPASLTFDSSNWMINQNFTISGVIDADVRDEQETIALTPDRGGVPSGVVNVTVIDPNNQGIVLDTTSVTFIEGGAGEFNVSLAQEPTNPVTITITSDNGEIVPGGPLTFDASNFSTAQAVSLGSPEDIDLDDERANLTVSITSSQGSGSPEGATNRTVSARARDNDTQGITVTFSPVGLTNSAQENGPAVRFFVNLTAPPRGPGNDVLLITPPAGHTFLAPGSLTFTDGNYATPQEVSWQALHDADTNSFAGNFRLRVDESGDPDGPHADVVVDHPIAVRDDEGYPGDIQTRNFNTLTGATEFTQRGNIAWGIDTYAITGRGTTDLMAAVDNRDVSGSPAFSPAIASGTINGNPTTEIIKWNSDDGVWDVFSSDATGIVYARLSADGSALALDRTTVVGVGQNPTDFSVTRNGSTYGLVYRRDQGSFQNLWFTMVNTGTGAATTPTQVSTATGNTHLHPQIHYVGGSGSTYLATATPWVVLYTESGSSSFRCVRLTTAGGNLATKIFSAAEHRGDFSSSVWDSAGNRLVSAHHNPVQGLVATEIFLPSAGADACLAGVTAQLRTAVGTNFISPPQIAYNGVEFAVAFDDTVVGVPSVGVATWNGVSALGQSNILPSSPGQNPSIAWALDRWILRYATTTNVVVKTSAF